MRIKKFMAEETRLIRKIASERVVCTYCRELIIPGAPYYREEGTDYHIHSLIARNYCENCYAKYGEKILTK
jgi:RNase P subunit RPR2